MRGAVSTHKLPVGKEGAGAMKRVIGRWAKPLLFGAVAAVLAAGFLHRRSFLPDIEEIRAKEQQKYGKKLQVVLERRERQLLEIEQKKSR